MPAQTPLPADLPANYLTATQTQALARAGKLTITDIAQAHLARVSQRGEQVKAWAYINERRVLDEAARLDALAPEERGSMWGLVLGVKDMIQTRDMPTRHGSRLYDEHEPNVDADVVTVCRNAGALILGKTHTTEFAFTTIGPETTNPFDPARTPGGSSSGSGAAVGDWQCHVAIGTQTIGSVIRPASYNGIFGFKPTWGAITREGLKISSLTLDTPGFFARSIADLQLVASTFGLQDDAISGLAVGEETKPLSKCSFAFVKTDQWASFGKPDSSPSPELERVWERAKDLLRSAGACVVDLELPSEFDDVSRGTNITVLDFEAGVNFLPEYSMYKQASSAPQRDDSTKATKPLLHPSIVSRALPPADDSATYIHPTRTQYTSALDRLAALRPRLDALINDGGYDALITPSAPGMAPEGTGYTGDSRFCGLWTALHVPVVNVPGFAGDEGMPLGLTLVAPRFHDVRLLGVAGEVAKVWVGADGDRLRRLPAPEGARHSSA